MVLLYHTYMGNSETSQINYEVIQDYLHLCTSKTPSTRQTNNDDNNNTILINTLSPNDQDCVIYNTTPPENEEQIINELLEKRFSRDANYLVWKKLPRRDGSEKNRAVQVAGVVELRCPHPSV